MQFVLNFRNVLILLIVLVGGYYCYRNVFADVESKDMGKLLRSHRDAPAARQVILKRRILAVYESGRDRDTVVRALDSVSPVTQALAVEVLAEKCDQGSLPKRLEMLNDPTRADLVKGTLAHSFASPPVREAIPRLVELTDVAEAPAVRSAAHNALKALTGVGGEIKLGDATRQHWSLWLRNKKDIVNR